MLHLYLLLVVLFICVLNFIPQPQAETEKEFMLSTHKLHIEASLDKEVMLVFRGTEDGEGGGVKVQCWIPKYYGWGGKGCVLSRWCRMAQWQRDRSRRRCEIARGV